MTTLITIEASVCHKRFLPTQTLKRFSYQVKMLLGLLPACLKSQMKPCCKLCSSDLTSYS